MCGILGAFNAQQELIEEIFKNLSMRGRDGTGYFIKDVFKEAIVKDLKTPENIQLPQFEKNSVFIANTRAVPTTEYESGAGFEEVNQQPFENDEFVVVHNGIIANDKELRKEFSIETESVVDSSLLPDLFSKVGVVDGLKKIEGSYSIMAFNKHENKFYVATNFMPLHYILNKDSFVFFSSKEMTKKYSKKVDPYTCLEISIKENISIKTHSLWKEKRNNKALIICSSGIDSTTTAYVYKYLGYEVGLIHFTYGQAAEEAELFAVKQIAKDLDANLYVFDAKPTFAPFKDVSRLLHQKEANPDEQMLDAESTHSYVPNRNAILAMVAAGIAEKEGYDTLAYGGQQMDSVYPDNNPDFVESVDKLLKYSLNWNTNIHFAAPLIHLIKHEIVALGKLIGVNYDLTCSCYYPKIVDNKVVHCHKCGCCQFRDAALRIVNERTIIKDADYFILKYVYPFI